MSDFILTDKDSMPFGKHKGTPMQSVPAEYMFWLWVTCDLETDFRKKGSPVACYIKENLSAYKKEYTDGDWRPKTESKSMNCPECGEHKYDCECDVKDQNG